MDEPRPAPIFLIVRLVLAVTVPLLVFVLPDPPAGSEAAKAGLGPSTLLPALFAISLAFATRRTVWPLLGGVWLGATMLQWDAGSRGLAPLAGAWQVLDDLIIRNAVYDPDGGGFQDFNLSLIGFVFALVAMVAVTTRAGGMAGVAERFVVLARSARATRLATWGMGLAVFFDDYANTLIVGGTMRPLADRQRISREKLSWIVDSTAAPVAGLSILSTWVAFEVSQFSDQLPLIGRPVTAGYAVFLETLPYRFYCILTLVFVGLICATSRDFGPMLSAERRAARTGAVFRPGARPMSAEATAASAPKEGIPAYAHVALLPIGVTIACIAAFFWLKGEVAHADHLAAGLSGFSGAHVRAVLSGVEDNTLMLFSASLVGLGVALALVFFHRLLTGREAMAAASSGSRAMVTAVGVLLLAWAMATVCDADHLGTRVYLVALADHAPAWFLPAGLFILSCGVSFATGSSWSTMGILLPNVIALAAAVGETSELGATAMVIICIGSVLDGSIFGDHCSPISDTTILSSTATGSDHIDHVTTQVPYALTVMAIAIGAGYLPAAAGLAPLVSLGFGVAALALVVWLVGRPIESL